MLGASTFPEDRILIINFEDFIILPLILVLLFLSLKICYRKFMKAYNNATGTDQQCSKKYCIRCRKQDFGKEELLARLENFKASEKIDNERLARLTKSINAYDNMKLTASQSNYEWSWYNAKQAPTVLHLQDLDPITPYHAIDSDLEILQDSKLLEHVQEELLNVVIEDSFWEKNDVPMGSWKLYYFFNQGKMQTENCKRCPKTTEIILKVPSFMESSPFGNAAFSILFPGSKIKTHCGATNARLRCHLTVLAGKSCTLTVGREKVIYEKGKLILFDDSFPHSVAHDSVDQDIRVVLLIDLWHPAVTDTERRAIEKIYTF